MTKRPKKIEDIFNFLTENHKINKLIQRGYIQQTLASCKSVEDKARLLLFKTYNTQSRPDLDSMAMFFMNLEQTNKSLSSFNNFSQALKGSTDSDDQLFDALEKHKGWGKKTAALLVRNLAIIQTTPTLKNQFWGDLDEVKGTKIYLPVDAVIEFIFATLIKGKGNNLSDTKLSSFDSINRFLMTDLQYTNKEMLIWDDLWFWGFITQNSQGRNGRKLGWNEAKYWSIFTAPKDKNSIEEIQSLAGQFLKKLQ